MPPKKVPKKAEAPDFEFESEKIDFNLDEYVEDGMKTLPKVKEFVEVDTFREESSPLSILALILAFMSMNKKICSGAQ